LVRPEGQSCWFGPATEPYGGTPSWPDADKETRKILELIIGGMIKVTVSYAKE